MDELSAFIADFMRRMDEDAAQALADVPADRDAGVLVTPVLLVGDREIELDPVAYYRPREVLRG